MSLGGIGTIFGTESSTKVQLRSDTFHKMRKSILQKNYLIEGRRHDVLRR